MGFFVKPLKAKKKPPFWKLQFISYTKDEAPGTDRPRKTRDIPPSEWHLHGFFPGMSLEDAQARQRQLNVQHELKRREERKGRIRDRLRKEGQKLNAVFAEGLTEEFERRVLFAKLARNEEGILLQNKLMSHWRAVRRMIVELQMEPSEWHDEAQLFYNYFSSKRFSPAYVQKI